MKTIMKVGKRLLFVLLLLLMTVQLTGCLQFLAALLPILKQVGQIVSTIGGLVGGQAGQIMQGVGKAMTGMADMGSQLTKGMGGGGGAKTGTGGGGNGVNAEGL